MRTLAVHVLCSLLLLPVATSSSSSTSAVRTQRYRTRRELQSSSPCSEQLDVCQDELRGVDDLDMLVLQATTRQIEEKLDSNATVVGGARNIVPNPVKALQGLFYQVAGEDGPLAGIGYFLQEGGDLRNVLGMLNPLEVADSVIFQWIGEGHPLLTVASTMVNRLFPAFSLETIFSRGENDTEVEEVADAVDLETTLTELRSLVATAKTERKLQDPEKRVPSLIRRLVGSIFFLAPKDVADLLSLPFFLVANRRRVDGDAAAEEEDEDGIVGQLLGVPIVVISTRYVISRLFPDLLLTDLIPDLPFLDRLVATPAAGGQESFEQFSNETMEELRTILADSTNSSGLFEEDPEAGQSALDIVQGFAKVEVITLANFLNDPIVTAVRLAVAAVLATTGVASRLSAFRLPSTTAILEGVLTTVGLNATETLPFFTRLVGIPLIGIVAEGFPPLKNLLDGFDAIASNILQVVFPDAISELQTVVADNFSAGDEGTSPFSQFFSGFGCKIALASCSARSFLANALSFELQAGAEANPADAASANATDTDTDPLLEDLVEEEAKSTESGTSPRMSSVQLTFIVAGVFASALVL